MTSRSGMYTAALPLNVDSDSFAARVERFDARVSTAGMLAAVAVAVIVGAVAKNIELNGQRLLDCHRHRDLSILKSRVCRDS